MTDIEINELFTETIHKTRALYNKIEGFSEDTIYNWKKGRTTPTLGDKLSVLYQMNLINIKANGESI